jgi:hypothetical protein
MSTAINKCKHDGGDGRCDEASFCIQEIGRLKAALKEIEPTAREIADGFSQWAPEFDAWVLKHKDYLSR